MYDFLAASLLSDFYKISHKFQYPEGTELIYSTWTPRVSREEDISEIVVFGLQPFIKTFLIDFFNVNFFGKPKEKIKNEYERLIRHTFGIENPDSSHIVDLHELGFLPIEIRALAEGSVVPLRTPVMTIHNSNRKFFWVTNYFETIGSCELWGPSTVATIAHEYRKLLSKAAIETVGDDEFVQFQGHDFSFRGDNHLAAAMINGIGHLLSFVGTDTIPAIQAAEYFYNANIETELVGCSVNATEHSIQCTYGNDYEYYRRMLQDVYPTGIISIVSDGYDFWDVIGNVIPSHRDLIMARDGKTVVRPDSGDPVLILCGDPLGETELQRKGAVEALWDVFGGTVTPQGYKILDSHIGLIYGDAITRHRAKEIVRLLKAKGFASINSVLGIGSFSYQYVTRDTFGWALKSTYCKINGTSIQIFKDPKTDDGTKKSQKGCVVVYEKDGVYTWEDQKEFIEASIDPNNKLQPIFRNGKLLVDDTLAAIRERLKKHMSKCTS